MKKRLISLLVALCMAVTLLPVSAITAWAEGGGQLKIVKGGYPEGSNSGSQSCSGTVQMYDERVRGEGDNPTIGIVLCSETDEDIARYSVLHDNDRLFASKYMLYMPTEEELREEIERQKTFFRLQHDNSPKEEV